MKKLLLGLLMVLITLPAFADVMKTLPKQLTISGTPISATTIAAGSTITSDSVYQPSSLSFGYSALAINATAIGGVTPNIKLTYQVSYDNANWFSPALTNGSGAVTVESTLDSAVGTGNTWVVFPYTVYAYDRFIFKNNSATTDSVTAETVYQVAQ